jgi:hypothetical protein
MSSRMAEKLAPDRQTSTWPTIPRANNARAESNSGFFVLSINVPPLWVNAIALTASSETYGLDPNALAGAHDVVSRGFKRAHGASPNSMWQAPSFAAEIGSSRLRLAAVNKPGAVWPKKATYRGTAVAHSDSPSRSRRGGVRAVAFRQ